MGGKFEKVRTYAAPVPSTAILLWDGNRANAVTAQERRPLESARGINLQSNVVFARTTWRVALNRLQEDWLERRREIGVPTT